MGKLNDEYNELLNAEKRVLYYKYNINDLFLSHDHYDDWFVPPLKGD